MNAFRKYFLPLAGAASMALGLTLAGPRAAHAVAAILVQVTNTAANPAVIQDVSKLSSQQVELQCATTVTGCFQYLPNGLTASQPYIVPPGQTLVVSTVDVNDIFGSCPATTCNLGVLGSPNTSFRATWVVTGPPSSKQYQYPSGIAFPAGSQIYTTRSGDPVFVQVLIFGYLTSN